MKRDDMWRTYNSEVRSPYLIYKEEYKHEREHIYETLWVFVFVFVLFALFPRIFIGVFFVFKDVHRHISLCIL